MNRSYKKYVALLLACLMLLSLCACGKRAETAENVEIENALVLLSTVWAGYEDSEKFSCAGGSYENPVMDGPGDFGVDNKEMLDYMLGLPESASDKVDDAASLMHMMNANTFTCAAFRVVNAEDVSAVSQAIKDNLAGRQWMCGFPDKMLIISVGSYVVSVFGNEKLVNTFRDKTAAAYPTATILVEQAL